MRRVVFRKGSCGVCSRMLAPSWNIHTLTVCHGWQGREKHDEQMYTTCALFCADVPTSLSIPRHSLYSLGIHACILGFMVGPFSWSKVSAFYPHRARKSDVEVAGRPLQCFPHMGLSFLSDLNHALTCTGKEEKLPLKRLLIPAPAEDLHMSQQTRNCMIRAPLIPSPSPSLRTARGSIPILAAGGTTASGLFFP